MALLVRPRGPGGRFRSALLLHATIALALLVPSVGTARGTGLAAIERSRSVELVDRRDVSWRARAQLDARMSLELAAVQTQLCSAGAVRQGAALALDAIRGALIAEPLAVGVDKGPVAVVMSRMVSEHH